MDILEEISIDSELRIDSCIQEQLKENTSCKPFTNGLASECINGEINGVSGHSSDNSFDDEKAVDLKDISSVHSCSSSNISLDKDVKVSSSAYSESISSLSSDDDTGKQSEDESKNEVSNLKVDKENSSTKEVKGSNEVEDIPMKYLDLKVEIPGSPEPIGIQLTNHDTIQDVRQIVLEQPDCCYRTCFSLQLSGKRLDDFVELADVAGLVDGVVLKVVDEPYSVREVRIHVRRLRDLMLANEEEHAFTATDNTSLSFCSAITGIDVEEEALLGNKDGACPREHLIPPDYCILNEGETPSLEPLIIRNADTQILPCLKDLRYSAWNPPPGNRKLAGDLLYLLIVTLEDNVYHITASSNGFFVNKCTHTDFNPNPQSEPSRSQTLVSILNQLSPQFKKSFANMQKLYDTSLKSASFKGTKKHPLELVASPLQVFPWISPDFKHCQDPFRAEDAVTNRIGYEEQIPGQLRDWNEELQSAKELPKSTLHQRVLRDRALYKITCDFIAAATRGAMAVVDGNVMAINPGEEEKMRMYIWNNLFFSFACDSREHYEKYGGDEAAYAAASLDLAGVAAYNRLDIEGLHTLGTVVVDYRGYRIVSQSIIPGILQREQENSVVYGSVDGGKTITGHDKFLEMLSKAGTALKIRPHKVVNEKQEDINLCSSIECKGIIGADGRHYILDLFRTFPPDVNFLDVNKVERTLIDGHKISKDKKSKDKSANESEENLHKLKYPTPHKHQLCSLRPVLVEAFHTFKYLTFVNIVARTYREEEAKLAKKKSDENIETYSEKEVEDGLDTKNNLLEGIGKAIGKPIDEKVLLAAENEISAKVCPSNSLNCVDEGNCQDSKSEGVANQEISKSVLTATMAVGSLSSKEFDIRFNPDAHVKEIHLASSEIEVDKLDKSLIEDAATFLSESMIPKLVEDFSLLLVTPIDGMALTEIMHTRGINMRYLGRLASLCSNRPNLDHIYRIAIKEMVVRSAKRSFKSALQNANQRCLAIAVSHFLNCFLGSVESLQLHMPSDEFTTKKKKNKKKLQKMPHHLPANNDAWMLITPPNLWTALCDHINNHFGFTIDCTGVDDLVVKYKVHKLSLLRELCHKTGIQILLREYDLYNRKTPPFLETDVLNLFPVVKCITPKATDANSIFEAANARLSAGFIGDAHELLIEALNMLNQVYGPLHPEIVHCYCAIAKIHYIADDAVQAVSYQKKAVIVAERVLGIDHPETLETYRHLALYCYQAHLVLASLKLMYRARYLALLCYGECHPEIATYDTNIGLMLHNQREFALASSFLERAVGLQMKYYGRESLHTATGHHLVARALSAVGEYKTALTHEKTTNTIYQKHFGKDDTRTKESSDALKSILNHAVMLEKTLKDISEKGTITQGHAVGNIPTMDDDEKKIFAMVNKIAEQIERKQDGKVIINELP